MNDQITYIKKETSFFIEDREDIIFNDVEYEKYEKEEALLVHKLENLDVMDVHRYAKDTL